MGISVKKAILAATFFAAFFAMSACSEGDSLTEPSTSEVAVSEAATKPFITSERLGDDATAITTEPPPTTPALPHYIPAIKAMKAVDGQPFNGEVILTNGLEYWYSGDEDVICTLELTCQETLTDLLIICLYAEYDEGAKISNEEWVDAHSIYSIRNYLTALEPGQAIHLTDAWIREPDNHPFDRIIRITYTNSAGEGEAVVVFWDEVAESFVCRQMPFLEVREGLDEYGGLRYGAYSDPVDIADDESFAAYTPHGFQLHHATRGDVNGDGHEDALLIFMAAGAEYARENTLLPMFILLGQPEGGYMVAQKIADVTYSASRHHTTAVVGDEHIDIVSEWSGGAAYSYVEVARFSYDSAADDWLMTGYSSRHVIDYERTPGLELVAPLTGMAGMPLAGFKGIIRPAAPESTFFDATASLTVMSGQSFSGKDWLSDYFVGVRLSEDGEHYEGYIFYSGNFSELKGTFRGEYPGGGLSITVDEQGYNFSVCGDIWQYNKDIREFLLGGEYSWLDE